MNKYFFAVFALAFVFTTGVVYAENSTLGDIRDQRQEKKSELIEKKQEVKEKKQEVRQTVKDKEASRRAEINQKAKEAVLKRLGNISKHLNAYLKRLDKIASKIENRVAKLKEKGVDTSKAEKELAEARVLGEAAKVAVDKAVGDIGSIPESADIKTLLEGIKSSIKSAKDALFAYHKGLVEAVRELKAAKELREGSAGAGLE